MTKRHKPYWEMNTEELREATRKYDKPFVALNESQPLTTAQRQMLKRARHRRLDVRGKQS